MLILRQAQDRLYNRTGSEAQTNAYNGLDDRVKVTAKFGASKASTRTYVYDPDGRLLGEYGAAATSPVAETIWLSPEVANDNAPFGGDDGVGGEVYPELAEWAPLAVATGSGAGAALYWVHGNHMGVPIVTTNARGTVATPPAYTMAGFPGQTKTLSDIYYNRYRDYDSSLGRYIQADPIGLGGGSNPFLYAEANPLKNMDPMGLLVPPAPVVVLAAPEAGGAAAATVAFCATPVGWFVCGGVAVAAVGTAGYLIYKHCKDGKCPPCRPYAVGRLGYQGPKVSQQGWDVGTPHYIWFQVEQKPSTCQCIWKERTKQLEGNHHASGPPVNGVNLNGRGRPPTYP